MLKILVDTCVWRHWFTFNSKPEKLDSEQYQFSHSFDAIYRMSLFSDGLELLYNALIVHELGLKYKSECSKYILPIARKIVIPLSRMDGLYKHDGSILFGGKMGGSLKNYLTFYGYQHESMIKKEVRKLKPGEKLYETEPRKKELDVEHMESALEENADLFITNDKKILKRLEEMSLHFDSDHPVNKIFSITRTPADALPYIKKCLNA